MRSTARLTAVITFVSMLAMLLMLSGCIASFLWLNKERIKHQFNTLTTSVDQSLFNHTPAEMEPWLRGIMPVVNIEKLELYDGKQAVLSLSRHEVPLVEDTPNQFYSFSAPLLYHPSLTLRIAMLNPAWTWLRSFIGISTFVFMGIVVLVMSVLLVLLHFWLLRQSTGVALLEARTRRILQGERSAGVKGDRGEWPAGIGQALDRLLQEIEQAGVRRARIDKLIREFASLDTESGLHNRLFFDNRFATLLDTQEEASDHGCIMMIRFSEADLPGTGNCGQDDNQRLFEFLHGISALLSCYPGALLARYFQQDYAVLLPHRSLKDAESIAAKLLTAADALVPLHHYDKEDFIHIAISDWRRGQSVAGVMEQLHIAMRRATLLGGNNWAVEESHAVAMGRGSVRWRTLLDKTYQQGGPRLYQKAVTDLQGQVHHRALQGRIKEDKKYILAAEYMPLVCDMGMAACWDRQLLTRIISLSAAGKPEAWSFPLTTDALLQGSFVQWLYKMLLHVPRPQRKHFLFELAEADVGQHICRLLPVLRGLTAFGCRIVVSQAGQTLVSSAYLQQVKPEIVKLDSGLVRNIDRRPENQLLVSSLAESCLSSSTLVFATGIRTQEEWLTLVNLGVSGGQGDYIAPPLPVKFVHRDN
ncbi:EAL domain-containing protein [Tatumella sp. JGM130]|uniref:RNase E specificity factor CsrD n=1 Tax=Tatumella sp. JGM130 TaxID=2799797 RepID=UPI001BAE7D60|nr:RNase E specificity factor CsrD [Tatumella sp. JGM130]MBS0893398.1 EAL domain-containing protein [Tatumella sp. JGM130]